MALTTLLSLIAVVWIKTFQLVVICLFYSNLYRVVSHFVKKKDMERLMAKRAVLGVKYHSAVIGY